MSIQAVACVLSHRTTRLADRLVLLAIANHVRTSAAGEWECWPSVKVIAEEANLAARVVQDAIARLEAVGALRREINAAPDSRQRGGYRTNRYVMFCETGQHHQRPPGGVQGNDTPDAEAGVHAYGTPHTGGGVHASYTPDTDRGVQARCTPQPPGVQADDTPGVQAPDAEGCRETTPEPLENRKKNEPPSREPRGTGPPPADAGDGPGTPLAVGSAARGDRIRQACEILAGRLADQTPGVRHRHGWIARVAARLAADHASAGHRLLTQHPDMPPGALAELLDLPPEEAAAEEARARARRSELDTHRQLRDTRATPADRPRNTAGIRDARDRLRNRDPRRNP